MMKSCRLYITRKHFYVNGLSDYLLCVYETSKQVKNN